MLRLCFITGSTSIGLGDVETKASRLSQKSIKAWGIWVSGSKALTDKSRGIELVCAYKVVSEPITTSLAIKPVNSAIEAGQFSGVRPMGVNRWLMGWPRVLNSEIC